MTDNVSSHGTSGNIHLRDPIQTRDDITDGADDKQIDAVFVDDDKATIFVIQGKFIGTSSVDAEPLREVLSAWIQMRDLVRLQEVGNNKLKQKLAEVARAIEDEWPGADALRAAQMGAGVQGTQQPHALDETRGMLEMAAARRAGQDAHRVSLFSGGGVITASPCALRLVPA
jgi:hypothetical protein